MFAVLDLAQRIYIIRKIQVDLRTAVSQFICENVSIQSLILPFLSALLAAAAVVTVILKCSPAHFHLSCRQCLTPLAKPHLPPVEVATRRVKAKSFPLFVLSPVKMTLGTGGGGVGDCN